MTFVLVTVLFLSWAPGALAAGTTAQVDPHPMGQTVAAGVDLLTNVHSQDLVTNVHSLDSVPGNSRTLSWSDWPVPLTPMVVGYSRYDDSSPLENQNRRRIYDAVVDGPGTYPRALAETVGVSRSTVRYHVRILEREGLVRTEKTNGKRRVFSVEYDGRALEPLVDDPAPGTVLTAIANHEPVSVSTLATTVDKTVSTVSYHLEQLESGGLIERERDDNTVLNRLTPDVRAQLQPVEKELECEPGELSSLADYKDCRKSLPG